MAYTETTTQSWFSRISDSLKGIIAGMALVVASVALLFWNEGRTIKTYKSLKEGAAAVVPGDSSKVDAALEGKLVHMTGEAVTDEVLTDDELKISVPAIKLIRSVQIYQWAEDSESKTTKKLGGSEETTTVYTYKKGWFDELIDSSSFKEAGHDNPTSVPYSSGETLATNVRFGEFQLSDKQIALIGNEQAYKIDRIDPTLGIPFVDPAVAQAKAAQEQAAKAAAAQAAPVAPTAAPVAPTAAPVAPVEATPAAPADAPAAPADAPAAPAEAAPSQSTSTDAPAEAPAASEAQPVAAPAPAADAAAPAEATATVTVETTAPAAPAADTTAPATTDVAAPAADAAPAEEELLTVVLMKDGKKLQVFNNGLYLGKDPAMPEIGDLKITYSIVQPKQAISIVSQQSGNSFVPWQAKAGVPVDLLKMGNHSAEEMFASAQSANTIMAWLLRIAGFALMFFGLRMILTPLEVIADVIPFIGAIVGAGVGIVSFIVAGIGSTVTIGIAWLYFRPVLAITLFVVAAVLLFWLGSLKKKAPAEKA